MIKKQRYTYYYFRNWNTWAFWNSILYLCIMMRPHISFSRSFLPKLLKRSLSIECMQTPLIKNVQRKTPSFLLYVTPNITPSPSLNPMPYCTTSCIILRQKTMYLHSSIFTGWLKIKCHFKKKKSFASHYDSGTWDEVTSKLLYLVSIEDSVTLLTICYQLKKMTICFGALCTYLLPTTFFSWNRSYSTFFNVKFLRVSHSCSAISAMKRGTLDDKPWSTNF